MYFFNPKIAADVFDNEYVIANLDTGLYYSVQGLAVSLLQALPFENEAVPIQQLAGANPGNEAEIAPELNAIWQQLLAEGIVLQRINAVAPTQKPWQPATGYAPSRFNRYADMQDLLTLDPVHDVDEDGWAVKQTN